MEELMEKEKVLDIEIKKINDEYSYWVVKKVNKIKLKNMPLTEIAHEDKKKYCFGYGYRTKFKKEYVGYEHHSCVSDYQIDLEIDDLNDYSTPYFIENKLVPDLQFLIDVVNEEYGIPERCRAKEREEYYFIDGKCEIWSTIEEKKKVDKTFFELGNYFKTKEEAEKVKIELDKFWAKVRAGEIGKEWN